MLSVEKGKEQQGITLKLLQMEAVVSKSMKPSIRAVGQQKY